MQPYEKGPWRKESRHCQQKRLRRESVILPPEKLIAVTVCLDCGRVMRGFSMQCTMNSGGQFPLEPEHYTENALTTERHFLAQAAIWN